jgi:hypothetical protein
MRCEVLMAVNTEGTTLRIIYDAVNETHTVKLQAQGKLT